MQLRNSYFTARETHRLIPPRHRRDRRGPSPISNEVLMRSERRSLLEQPGQRQCDDPIVHCKSTRARVDNKQPLYLYWTSFSATPNPEFCAMIGQPF